MSVANLLRAKEDAAFAHGLAQLIQTRGISSAELCRQAFGVMANGKPARSSLLTSILVYHRRPRDKAMHMLAPALGVSIKELIALRQGPVPEIVPVKAHTPVIATGQTKQKAVNDMATPADQFSLVIDHRGLATLRVNLLDVPMAVAMQAMAALTGAGLLSVKDEPRP